MFAWSRIKSSLVGKPRNMSVQDQVQQFSGAEEMAYRHMKTTYLNGHNEENPDAQGYFPSQGGGGGGGAAARVTDDTEQTIAFPLRLPGQEVVLFNRAHRHLSIHSPHPAARVLGLFPAESPELQRHVEQLQREWGERDDLDLHVCPAFTFTLIPETPLETEEELERVNALLRAHEEMLEARAAEFEENRQERKMGTVEKPPSSAAPDAASSPHEEEVEASPAADSAAKGACQDVPPINLAQEVRSQKFLVLSVLRGSTGETALCVYGAFEDEAKAKLYQRTVLAKAETKHHTDVHPMYEWIHMSPKVMDDDAIPRHYSNPELNAIMRTKRTQKQQVEQYLQHCEAAGQAPNIKEIDLSHIEEGEEEGSESEEAGASESKGEEA